ncbi:Carboxylesterase NlhH [Thalassoglobus neptunius]|uniref:Carboxylesterase NlhH n=1 Tax=Thalassoglobus neptunius TaxID=1938619 RepID=A0A5C5WMI3_9PLAN|nr:alpha/beta hydrolase [Thalassoglobus neptunius]TWT52024.1 Carboxylesterase NlhH [Thalassoglobus neptunius]
MVVPGPIRWLLILAIAISASPRQHAIAEELHDIKYATVDSHELLLDLYLPDDAVNPKLIVWVHGGAWRSGSRRSIPLKDLVDEGYAVASIDYRLSPVARFPAQIHDIKAAIRFLRAHASEYGYDARSIGIAGASAGGHLVALVGVTNGNSKLEGRVGGHLDQSSDVQAIIDLYGPTNLTTILPQSTPHGLGVRIPALQLLLGGQPEDKTELAELASPVFHVDASDPPLLMLHGDQDPQVPVNQSLELLGRYEEFEIPVELEIIHGGAHGGALFYDSSRIELMVSFLQKSLK